MTLSHFNSFCHKLLSAFLSFVIFVAPLAPIFHTTSVYAYDGCMDPGYLEYDPGADNDPGGYCITPKVPGCTDPTAFNYNPSANFDNGSCVPVVMGCTNSGYLEYNASANTDDGSCATPKVLGCTNSAYVEYNPAANVDNGSCLTLVPIYGCMNPAYVEYNAGANTDDGSCLTPRVCSITVNSADNTVPPVVVGNYLYVVGGGGNNKITVIDRKTNSFVGTINVDAAPQYLTAVGTKLYVSTTGGVIKVVNTITNTVSTTITVEGGGTPLYSIVFAKKLYVSGLGGGVVVIDTITDTVITSISGLTATGKGLTVVGTKLYVSGGQLYVIDTTSDTLVDTITSVTPYSFTAVGTKLYVNELNNGNVKVVDTITDTLVSTLSGFSFPYYSTEVGGKLYVNNNGLGGSSTEVTVIDTSTDTILYSITTGAGPYSSVAIGTKLYVNNSDGNSVSIINTISDTLITTLSAGASPWSSVNSGSKLYVNASNGVFVINTLTDTNDTTLTCNAPYLDSITSSTSNGNYNSGSSVNISANFNESLAAGSKMRVTLNTGAIINLTTISGTVLSGIYLIGVGETSLDLSVSSISSNASFTSVSDTASTPNTQTSYSVPSSPDLSTDSSLNLGDLKNISIGGAVCSITVGTNPYQMVTVGTLAYVANMGSDDVSVINTATNEIVGSPIDVGDRPYGLAYNSTTKELYIANLGDDTVSVIDADPANAGTTFKTVTHTINVGVEPYYVASLGTKMYVTNNISNSVSVINTATHTVTNTITVGSAPRAIKAHGTDLYVSNYGSGSYGSGPTSNGTVSVIDSTTNTVTDTITVGVGPRGLTVIGDEVYVANFEDDTVSVINALTNTVTHTISVGNTPRGITTLGTKVYVENYQAGTVSVINTATHAVTATVAVGNTPAGFTAYGTDLYISRFTDDVVSILDTTNNTMRSSCANDSTPPTFTMQIYSDSGLSSAVSDNARLGAGTYYVSVTADETLSAAPALNIAAQGTANDITGATMISVSGNQYKYTYIVSTDAAATGSVLADFSVSGTDSASNTATNVSPTNESTKAVYTDTVADSAPGTPDMTTGTDLGISSSDNITSDTTPTFTVSCVTDSTVTLYDNVTSVGSGTCVSSTVSITASALSAGTHATINAKQTDTVGNVSVASGNLSITIDTTAPTFSSANVNSSVLTMTYSEALNSSSAPSTGSFTVLADGVARSVSSVTVTSTTVVLTLASNVTAGQVVTVAYTVPGSSMIEDSAGNDAAALSATSVTNTSSGGGGGGPGGPPADITAPVLSSSLINGSTLKLLYNESLDALSVPSTAAYVVRVNGLTRPVSSVSIAGLEVTLTLSPGVVMGDAVTVSYTAPSSSSSSNRPVQDPSSNDAASFNALSVTNNTPAVDTIAPVYQSGYFEDTTMTIIYSESLRTSPIPPNTSFTVSVLTGTRWITRNVTAVNITGNTVTLTIGGGSMVGSTQARLAYNTPPNPSTGAIADLSGNLASKFSTVLQKKNNKPVVQPPTFNSAAEEGDTSSNVGSTDGKGINNTGFFYASEDPTIIGKLQDLYGKEVINETIYQNQCATNEGKTYYRSCTLGSELNTFDLFRENVVCEGFVTKQDDVSDYRFLDLASRKEVVGIAVKMRRENGASVSLISPGGYKNIFLDVGLPGEAPWIQPIVETALHYGIISSARDIFEADRNMTRSEAYAVILSSVCLTGTQKEDESWEEKIHRLAFEQGLTVSDWGHFEPGRPILRQELFALASRTSDWAERTGGCDPKPEYCFLVQ